jgi:hypothetical protein
LLGLSPLPFFTALALLFQIASCLQANIFCCISSQKLRGADDAFAAWYGDITGHSSTARNVEGAKPSGHAGHSDVLSWERRDRSDIPSQYSKAGSYGANSLFLVLEMIFQKRTVPTTAPMS